MAIAELTGQRGTAGGSASTTSTVTYTSAPTEGNLMVAMANVRGDVTPTVIPTGWAQAVTANGAGNDTYIFWKIAGASEGTTHQWTWSGSFKSAMVWGEWSGVATTSPLDATNSGTATSGTASTGATGTLAQVDELVIAAFGGDTNGTFSAYTTNYTQIGQVSTVGGSTATRNTGAMAARIVTATTTQTVTATWSASTKVWTAAVATFKASVSVSDTADAVTATATATANNATVSIKPSASEAIANAASGKAFSDDFNRADATTLGTNWIESGTPLQILSNQVASNGATSSAWWATQTATDNNYCQVYNLVSANAENRIYARGNSGFNIGMTAYAGQLHAGGPQIQKIVNGAFTGLTGDLGSTGTGTHSLTANGSTITLNRSSGAAVDSVTDTSITTGKYVGIALVGNATPRYDDFVGGDLASSFDATTSVATFAETSTATNSALDATTTATFNTNADAQTATATATANNASVSIRPSASEATASASALDATVSAVADVNADAQTAAATATSNNSTASVKPSATTSTAAASALDATVTTQVPLPTAHLLRNTFENGSNGAAVTELLTSGAGDRFFLVDSGSALTYDTGKAAVGTRSLHINATTNAYLRWDSFQLGETPPTTSYIRFYLYLTANPSTTRRFYSGHDDANTLGTALNINTTGKVQVYDLNGSVGTTTASISLNQWVRIEAKVVHSTTVGTIDVRLYNTHTSDTITETLSYTARNTGTHLDEMRFGNTGAVTQEAWMDDIAFSPDGWIGYQSQAGTVLDKWAGNVSDTGFTASFHTLSVANAKMGYTTNSDLTTGVTYTSQVATGTNGYTKFSASGLSANTTYYYFLEDDDGQKYWDKNSRGSVKTFPTAGSATSFSVHFGACMTSGSAAQALYGSARDTTRPLVWLQTGDLQYEDIGVNDQAAARAAHRIATEKSSLRTLLRDIPMAYMPDDHDYGANDIYSTGVSIPAVQAVYREMIPHWTLPVSDSLEQTFVIGRVRFILLDVRAHRSNPADTDNSSKTMLGSVQKAWLKSTLLNATEPVKIIVSPITWNTTTTGDDTWQEYNTERTEITDYISTNSITGVYVIAGDQHRMGADDGTNGPGGLPNVNQAPINNGTATKGAGTFSEGVYPATVDATTRRFYGILDFTDSGTSITLDYSGYDYDNDLVQLSMQTVFSTVPETNAPAESAAATATSLNSSVSIAVQAQTANASAAANSATASINPSASTASATSATGGITFSDDFNRADNPSLGPNWIEDDPGFSILSNEAKTQDANGGWAWWATPCSTDNNYGQVKFAAGGANPNVLAIRGNGDPDSQTGYGLRINTVNPRIVKVVAGTVTDLGPDFGSLVSGNSGDVVKVEVLSDTITAYVNGGQEQQLTDTSITSGKYVGFRGAAQATAYDDFSGGDLAYSVDPTTSIATLTEVAPSTADANDSTVTTSGATNAFAQVATATLTANDSQASVATESLSSTATAAAQDATVVISVSTSANAETATASSAGSTDPTVSVDVNAQSITTTAQSQQPTTTRTGRALAETATGSGVAHAPTVTRTGEPNAQTAAVSAAAQGASNRIHTGADSADSSALALQPTISTGSNVNATAEAATASASSLSPQEAIAAGIASATATGLANDPTVTRQGRPLAQTATASATVTNASVTRSGRPNAEASTASAISNDVAAQISTASDVATAGASALDATVTRTGNALSQTAPATATALDATVERTGQANAETALADASAHNSSVNTTGQTNAQAQTANATATSHAPQRAVVTHAQNAAASATSQTPDVLRTGTAAAETALASGSADPASTTRTGTPLAQTATATASVENATVNTDSATNAAAGLATAATQAQDATATVSAVTYANAGVAESSAVSEAETAEIAPAVSTAEATGTSFNVTSVQNSVAYAEVALASSAAHPLAANIQAVTEVAAAVGSAVFERIEIDVSAQTSLAVASALTAPESGDSLLLEHWGWGLPM